MVIVGSIPVKSREDIKRQIKRLWKEFNGKVNVEINNDRNLLIYKHYFSCINSSSQNFEEDDIYGNKGA